MKRWELLVKDLWLAIRRSRKDERALKRLLASGSIVLICIAYGLYMIRAYRETGPWGLVFEGGMLGLGFAVAVLIRKAYQREDDSRLSLSFREQKSEAGYEEHRKGLAEELLRTAVMVDRAAAEVLHFGGQMAVDVEGSRRQRGLALARRTELWDGFGEARQNLLMDAEGGWPQEMALRWLHRQEDLRVLRWTVGLDEVLVPFEFVTMDLLLAIGMVERPEVVLEGTICRPPWDLRPGQTVATAMLNRCFVEGVARGLFEAESEETRAACVTAAAELKGAQGEDLLIGAGTVAEAGDDEVRSMARTALRRLTVLTAVIDWLNGPGKGEVRLPDETDSGGSAGDEADG